MVEIKLPTYGLTERIRQTLVDYHTKILEIGKKVGYPETIAHEQHKNGIYTKETSKCIPLFLNEEYEPFQYPEDLSCTCSESIYCKLYNPINIFWRDCSNIDHVPLEEQLIIYNRAYAIALHALNTVIRPNEYLDGYISFALKQNYILHICIMGVVYCLLSNEQRTPYTNILLDDIKKILQDDFPEIIEVAIAYSQPPSSTTETATEKEYRKSEFYNVIQYEDPQALLKRLHLLIDGKKGADVGCVFLRCQQEGYITRNPTQKEFKSEFELKGSWQAIHKYMNEGDMNALDRANKVIIFE